MPLPAHHRFWLITACLVLAAGCSHEQSQPTEQLTSSVDVDATDKINQPSPPNAPVPPDRSMTIGQYIQAAVPADDRSWTGDEMTRAAKVLEVIAQMDAGQLPRYQSLNSGKMFQRLTADDNLDFYRNRSLPISQRFPDALDYIQSANRIFKVYGNAFINKQAVGDSELIELLGSQLRVTVVMIDLVNEFTPTLDKNDRTYPVRMLGLQKMRNGFASIVAGNVQTLTESHAYRTPELKRLAGYMEATFPMILPEMPPNSRLETEVRFRSLLKDPKMQHLKSELAALLAVAEKSASSQKTP